MAKKIVHKEEEPLFKDMLRDEQAKIVRKDMKAGGSYKSVAAKYGVGVGRIAGICRDYDIPSTHEPPSMGKGKAKRKKPVKKAHTVKKLEPKPAAKKAREVPDIPGLRESPSEASRCEFEYEYCPYEAKPGTRFCPLHQKDPARR